jgi:hypothetical protein
MSDAPDDPIAVLERWEEHGAVWRTWELRPDGAVVQLCSCTGEPMDELRSDDPELLRYLARRPRSDPD